MKPVTAVLKRKVLRRAAPVVFAALAGVGLAACGSAGANTGSGGHHSTTTTPQTTATTNPTSSGGTGF